MTTKEAVLQFQMAVAQRLQGEEVDLSQYLTEDVRWHLPLSLDQLCNGAERSGRDEVLDLLQNTVRKFYLPQTMQFDFHSMIGEGELVHMHFSLRAETADGRDYHNRYQTLFRVEDGRVAEVWEYFDAGILLQLYSD